jgi:hypothetical protein
MMWELKIPGAARVAVRFHPLTCLSDGDKLVIYKSKRRDEDDVWASFDSSSNWPGTGDKDSLEVASDVLYVGFYSARKQGQSPWGFKLYASATHFQGESLQTTPTPKNYEKKKSWNTMLSAMSATKHLQSEFREKEKVWREEAERLAAELAVVSKLREALEHEKGSWVKRLKGVQQTAHTEKVALQTQVSDLSVEVQQLKDGGKIEMFEKIARQQAKQRAAAQVELHKELNKQEVLAHTQNEIARAGLKMRKRNSLVMLQKGANKVLTEVKVTGVARAARGVLKQQISDTRKTVEEQKKMYVEQAECAQKKSESVQDELLKEIFNKDEASPQQLQQKMFLGAMSMSKSELDSMHNLLDLSKKAVTRVTKTVKEETGYNISSVEKDVIKGVVESRTTYTKAATWLLMREGGAFARLKAVPDQGVDFEGLGVKGLLQNEACSTLEGLLSEAAEAQQVIRSTVVGVLRSDDQNKATGGRGEGWAVKREFRIHAEWAVCLFDPGIKSSERTTQKVEYKYGGGGGKRSDSGYCRVHDASRLAIICTDCEMILRAIEQIQRLFDVVELQNRHRKPTVLGWADVTVLVRIPLAGGRSHIGEIQIQHNHYFRARLTVHQHYVSLRSALPGKCNVKPHDLERVQKLICDQVERMIEQTEWNKKKKAKKAKKKLKTTNFMAPTAAALARAGSRRDIDEYDRRRPSLEGRRRPPSATDTSLLDKPPRRLAVIQDDSPGG